MASSLFNARKAASASVNWMYFVQSSPTLAHEIRAQQIGAFARVTPGAPVFDQRPAEPQLAALVAHGHPVQVGDAAYDACSRPST